VIPRGKVTDYGDLLHVEQWLIKGRRLSLKWRIGAPYDTTPADRVPGPVATPTGRFDLIMDLLADKQVPLSLAFTDELDNPVETPADATVTYTVDDASLINLTDNGDGTATAAAVGPLGSAVVSVSASWSGGSVTGDLLINVVAGLAERVTIVAGEPTEVTPDA
jgi:hypothetical protein